MNQETKRPITLEDILRLKRAERPPAEFWSAFDRELREKQLAALVEKRPWWRTLPRPLAGLSRYHLPIGAAAILAITFLATRDYHSVVPAPGGSSAAVSAVESSAVSAPALVVADLGSSGPSDSELAESIASESFAYADAPAPADVARLISGTVDVGQSDTPSVRLMAEHLKVAQSAEPATARGLLSPARGFETRALSARMSPVEPLAQMTGPAAVRSAKFNSALALLSTSSENSTRSSERAAHRLSNDGDDRLYETVSRVNARGDKFGLKL